MAIENEELTREMQELTRQMQGLGTDTAKADNELTKFAKSASAVGGAMAGAAGQVMKGSGAFASLNGAIDLATKAIGGIVGAMPVIGGAAKEFANGVGEAAKFVMNQLDDLSKNYEALGESGALAADGINGIQRQFRQMGLVSLPTFTKAISQNSTAMAALGGSMSQGAEQFSKIAGQLTTGDLGGQFIRLGMGFDQVGESAGKYVGALSRYGLAQGRSTEQLTASTAAYIQEVDAIARITGASRKQQEDEQQKSLASVQFRAKIADMVDKGQIEEANRLQTYVNGLTGAAADAARAMVTGIPLTKEAAQANMLSRDSIRQNIRAVKDGKDATVAVNDTYKGLAQGAKTFRSQLMYAADGMGSASLQALDAEALQRKQRELEAKGIDPVAAAKQAQAELMASKGATGAFADAKTAVAGSAKDLQNLSFNLVKNVVPAVDAFAGAIKRVTGFIDTKFSVGPTPPAGNEGEKKGGVIDGINNFIRGLSTGGAAPAESKIAPATGSKAAILDLIGKGESQGNYNALVYGKKGHNTAKEADLIKMTIAQVQEYQKGMIGRGHASTAVGKYQMIASTLAEQVKKAGLDPSTTKFDQKTQDLLAGQLVDRAGYGKKDSATVMKNLAGTWASLPKDMSGSGRYDNDAQGNKAHINPAALIAAITNPTASATPTGPTTGYQSQMAGVNPAAQIGTNTQPTAAGAPAPQTTEVQTGLLASINESLASLNKTNQDQLSVQKRQLKATT